MNEDNTVDAYEPDPAPAAPVAAPRANGPLEVPLSPEDFGMILRANNATKTALQELGIGTRNLEVLKVEIAELMAKEENKMKELSARVTAAEGTFSTITKAMATKYDIDLNNKCNIDLNRGFFLVG